MATYYPERDEFDKKSCLINLKKGFFSDGRESGTVLDNLTTCCEKFETLFFNSGNKKRTSFDSTPELDPRNGINLTLADKSDVLILKINQFEHPIHYCPFCGADIELKVSKEVTLIIKMKLTPEKYLEVSMPPKITG